MQYRSGLKYVITCRVWQDMALPPSGRQLSKRIVVPFPTEAPLSGALIFTAASAHLQAEYQCACLKLMSCMFTARSIECFFEVHDSCVDITISERMQQLRLNVGCC